MKPSFRNKLIASSALAVSLVSGYARRSYAIDCGTAQPDTYLCTSGYSNTVILGGNRPITYLSTTSGFSATPVTGAGVSLNFTGQVDIQDYYNSIITSTDNDAFSLILGNYGATPGGGTININSTLTGQDDGLSITQNGIGNLDVKTYGTISGGTYGITIFNMGAGNIYLTTGASSNIQSSGDIAIRTSSYGGDLNLNIDGIVVGDRGAIMANGSGANTNVTINIASTANISTNAGSLFDETVYAITGSGDINITVDGDITSGSTAIHARQIGNYDYGITITTNNGSDIVADRYGIQFINYSYTAASTVNIDSFVHANYSAIYGRGRLTDMVIGSNAVIRSDVGRGIHNETAYASSMLIEGDIFANNEGVYASSYSNDFTVNTGNSSQIISYNNHGISIEKTSTGLLDVDIAGRVTSYGSGRDAVHLRSAGNGINFSTQSGAYIQSTYGGGLYARLLPGNTGDIDVRLSGANINVAGRGVDVATQGAGQDIFVRTYTDTNIISTGDTGILAVSFSSGEINLDIGGTINATGSGVMLLNSGSNAVAGRISLTGDVTSANGAAVYAYARSGDLDITIGNTAHVTSTNSYGLSFYHNSTGNLTVNNMGRITGDTGVLIRNTGKAGLFMTDGVIEGTNGRAIYFYGYNANAYNTERTEIYVSGGRIIGDVIDNYSYKGISAVTIASNFTSEGNFDVSFFDVYSNGDFTLDGGDTVKSFYGIDVYGTMRIGGAGAAALSDMRLHSSSYLNVDDDFIITGDFLNTGTTNIATGKTLTVDTMAAGAIGNLNFGFNTAADHAQMVVANGAADITNQTLYINVTGVTGLANNEQALLISGTGNIVGGPGGTRTQVGDSSILWDFDIVDGTNAISNTSANDLFLISHQAATVSTLADTQNNINTGDVLMTLQSTANPELAGIVGNMNGASTQQRFNAVLEAVEPISDASESAVMSGFIRQITDVTSERMMRLRHLDANGNPLLASLREDNTAIPQIRGLQAWAVGFGDNNKDIGHGLDVVPGNQWIGAGGHGTTQDARGGIDGYKVKSGGAFFGIDTGASYHDMILGLALGYGHAETTSDNANRAENKIDGFQMQFYATKKLSEQSYIDLAASFGRNQNNTTRHDVGGTPGLTAKGDFASYEAGLKATIGNSVEYSGYTLSPSFSMDWLHYMADDYTETGAGGANLNVETENLDTFEVGGRIGVARAFKTDSGAMIRPEIHTGYFYEIIGDPLQKTSSFTGGGAAFSTESPDPARHRMNIGAGVSFYGNGNLDYSLQYDLDLKRDYVDHSLTAKAAWKF